MPGSIAAASLAAWVIAAEPMAVAVFPIVAGEGGPALGAALSEELARALAFRPGARLVRGEELFVLDPAGEGGQLERCGSDVDCLSAALAPLGLGLAILIVANTELDPPRIAVRLIDPAGRRITAESHGKVDAAGLAQAVATRAAEVLDAVGLTEAGRLRVDTGAEPVELQLEPPPIASFPGGHWVAPGRQRIVVSRGEQRVDREVTVAAREDRTVSIVLEDNRSLVESPWLWIAIGLVVAGAATAVAVSASGGTDVCLGPPGADCP